MTQNEEPRPQETPPEESSTNESSTAVATPPSEEQPQKLRQEVQIRDSGPCRKHVRVEVNREDIDSRMADHFKKLASESQITGFRPGKAPRKLVEKRFFKEVSEQVKAEVLMASLQQLGEDYKLAPLAAPDISPDKIDFPKTGPLIYEFEVEVRPEFELPNYRGLKLKRPVYAIKDSDVADARRRVLAERGQVVPKQGPATLGDILIADVTFQDGDQQISQLHEASLNLESRLAFKDGLIERFAEQLEGVQPGESRTVEVKLSAQAAGGLANKTIQAVLHVKDIKTIRPPELTPTFLEEVFGIDSESKIDEIIRALLERDLEHHQRRSARLQLLQLIASMQWDLPEEMLMRHYRQARNRRIMEMRADGLKEHQIAQQIRLLEQNILANTALLLKEHFVLQKVAELEKIEIQEDDINQEIERLAYQAGESPRRLRARLEREDMIDSLAAEMIERRALDIILDNAQYEDTPFDPSEAWAGMASVDVQVVPGEMLTTSPTNKAS
jgi:trigger factor